VKGLAINGTPKFGFQNAIQKPGKLPGIENVIMPSEVLNGEELANADRISMRNLRPHSYDQGDRRDDGHWSHSDVAHAQMLRAEDGVVMSSNSFAINGQPFDPDNDDASIDANVVDASYCVCKSASDGYMVSCMRCSEHFHPGCQGKSHFCLKDLPEEELDHFMKLDANHYRASGDFQCIRCEKIAQLAQKELGTKQKRAGEGIMQAVREQAAADAHANAEERNRALFGEKPEAESDQKTDQKRSKRIATRQTEKNKGIDMQVAIPRGAGVQAANIDLLMKCETDIDFVNHLRKKKFSQSGRINCKVCLKKKDGLYYHCLSCKDFDCCDACAMGGVRHSHQSHRFVARHTAETHPVLEEEEDAAPGMPVGVREERKYKPASGKGAIKPLRTQGTRTPAKGRPRATRKQAAKSSGPSTKNRSDSLFVSQGEEMDLD